MARVHLVLLRELRKGFSLTYKRKKVLGFTLIEVMVATLFLSMLMLFAVSAVKNQARQTAVNRAAIEMKMWLHAALAYYADTSDWPTTLTDLGTDYYPTELLCSPFFERPIVAKIVLGEVNIVANRVVMVSILRYR